MSLNRVLFGTASAVTLLLAICIQPSSLAAAPPDSGSPIPDSRIASPNPDILEVEARARRFVQALANGESITVRGQMNERLRVALSNEAISRIFWDFRNQGGVLRDIGAARASVQSDGTVLALVPIHASRSSALAEVTFERLAPLAPISGFRLSRIDSAELAAYRAQGLLPADDQEPPLYVNTHLFSESVLSLPGPHGKVEATLTLPATAGKLAPAPAVILVPGLLFSDADGKVGESRVLRDLAQGLACRGIAAIRYAPSPSVFPADFGPNKTAQFNDLFAADALAASAALAARDEIDHDRVVVLGWELGALAAPSIAATAGAHSVVLLAPAPPKSDTYLRRRLAGVGVSDSDTSGGLELLAAAESQFGLSAAIWMDARHHEAVNDLSALGKPFVIFFAGQDPMYRTDDVAVWSPAVKAGGFFGFTKTYAGLDQYLRPQDKSGPTRYLDARVVEDIAYFVQKNRLPD